MPRSYRTGLLLAAVAGALTVSSFRSSTAQPAEGTGERLTTLLEGNYRVTLDYVFAGRPATSDKVERVRRIEFHPQYVVIIDQAEAGRVVPIQAISQLRWEPS